MSPPPLLPIHSAEMLIIRITRQIFAGSTRPAFAGSTGSLHARGCCIIHLQRQQILHGLRIDLHLQQEFCDFQPFVCVMDMIIHTRKLAAESDDARD